MKRWVLLLFTSFALSCLANAQLLSHVFSQKKTDIKDLTKQIALLQVYTSDIEKGYNIAKEGLTAIGEIKHGEFNLHSVFFNSLEIVNPSIKNYVKVAEIISYQVSITNDFKKILRAKNLNATEINYLGSIYSNMMSECAKSLSDLEDVISDNTFQMHDDERIKRIDALDLDMRDKYVFTESFASNINKLSLERETGSSDINAIENLE